MDSVDKYFNFVRNYNDALQKNGTDWLGPRELGDVILGTAAQNIAIERREKAGKRNVNSDSITKQKAKH